MSRQKLERQENLQYTMNSWKRDGVELWSSNIEGHNLSLKDSGGEAVLSIYGLQNEQLAELYSQIGAVLGLPSSVTMEHLRQMKGHLDDLFPPEGPPDFPWEQDQGPPSDQT